MPFELKNVGVTYQRLVNKMFVRKIGWNVEVYVDDMLVKSKEEDHHLDDLRETFETLCLFEMKLNPSKCVFGVSSWKFLGFMVSQWGVKANPNMWGCVKTTPNMRGCLTPDKADYVMREVHEGVCENHSGARSLVHKLIWAGYYWRIMQKDAKSYMKTCDKCQCFNNVIRKPSEPLTLSRTSSLMLTRKSWMD